MNLYWSASNGMIGDLQRVTKVFISITHQFNEDFVRIIWNKPIQKKS